MCLLPSRRANADYPLPRWRRNSPSRSSAGLLAGPPTSGIRCHQSMHLTRRALLLHPAWPVSRRATGQLHRTASSFRSLRAERERESDAIPPRAVPCLAATAAAATGRSMHAGFRHVLFTRFVFLVRRLCSRGEEQSACWEFRSQRRDAARASDIVVADGGCIPDFVCPLCPCPVSKQRIDAQIPTMFHEFAKSPRRAGRYAAT